VSAPRAVIDLGSNTFRLVVFDGGEDGWHQPLVERSEPVRIGADLDDLGCLSPLRAAHALEALRCFEVCCRTAGVSPERIDAVATSAIREARDGDTFVRRAREATGLPIRVLSAAEEAHYAYVAAVSSTSLEDGLVLDLGGGSLELVEVRGRRPRATASWPLGTVRVTEQFLAGDGPAAPAVMGALREHVRRELVAAPWVRAGQERIVGVGGTVRTLATAAIRAAELERESVQGFLLTREALAALLDKLAALPPAERDRIPGIKRSRRELVLGGAVVLQTVLEATGAAGIEATRAGLREGIFLSSRLPAARSA
jgi:exopolyphosphatase / guanosine-5'-triphosphate,3'-diphosphate pyrophosphatase